MTEKNIHIDKEVIIKILTGEGTDAEKIAYQQWLKKDTKNQDIAGKIQRVFELINQAKCTPTHEKNWKRVMQKIENEYEVPSYITLSQVSYRGITLTISRWHRVAAAIILIVGLGFLLKTTILDRNKVITIASTQEIVEAHLLPDGSKVSLNIGSSLTYHKKFNRDTREVKLIGEGYFIIKKDKRKPFIIHSMGTTTKVVGTEFNIYTDTVENIVRISVASGKVEFYNTENPSHKLYLTKGEEGICNLITQNMQKKAITDPNYMAWKTGILYFDELPLSQVITTLENYYHTVIIVSDTTNKDLRLTSKYDNQTLEQVLDEFKLLLGIDYKIINDTIYVK